VGQQQLLPSSSRSITFIPKVILYHYGDGIMASGVFVARVGPELHRRLKADAQHQGRSLNELCLKRLQLPAVLEYLPPSLATAASTVIASFGSEVMGLVVFGSFARQEATDASDIDLLVVFKSGAVINRGRYTQLEKQSPIDEKIETHLVSLPAFADRVSGLWAEVSLDGVIIFDRDFSVHRYLTHVRRLIAEEKVTRRRAHGQNYWIHHSEDA
jgi:predicted nucleotidyltransferase